MLIRWHWPEKMFGLTSVDNSKQNKEWGRVVNQQAVTCAWRSLNRQRRRSCIGCLLHTHTLSVEVHVFTITTHCPPLATELSRSLVLVCGMACRCMSPLRHRWQSYKAVSKHTCLGAPSHNIPFVKSPCSDTRHFEHYNRFCYLLVTY